MDVRVPFPAPATTQQQVLSSLTMLAQVMGRRRSSTRPQPVPQETTSGEGSD